MSLAISDVYFLGFEQTFACKETSYVKVRSSHRKCSVKKVFLEISQHLQENTCARNSFLIKCFQVLSCEFCEIYKNTVFAEHLWTTASVKLVIFTNDKSSRYRSSSFSLNES